MMSDYFIWPSVGNHRRQLQTAVRNWIDVHPDCCNSEPLIKSSPEQPRFQSDAQLHNLVTQMPRLHPGMTSAQVLTLLGEPVAIDSRETPTSDSADLLGCCAANRNEKQAFIYFIERWTNEISRRDPLHDRYVILFFSSEDKLTRVFSNVAEVPPVFPQTARVWMRILWGDLGDTH